MSDDIVKRKQIAVKAAKTVGKILLDNFKKPLKIKAKGDRDFVTQIDVKAENAVVKLVKEHFPKDSILSEENLYLRPEAEYEWIIDPLDGTHNYIHSIGIFGTSIAFAVNKQVQAGVIYMPLTDELYVCQKGKGSYKNGNKIQVSKRKLRESTLIFDSSIRRDKNIMLKGLGRLADEVFNVRMFGSSARHLAYVAEGTAEIDVEYFDKVWDFAAGLLLVEEAGGISSDLEGKPWNTDTKRYIASNKEIHKDIVRILNQS
ncbi:MAG: inositol monophosphatase [Candidatus Omnitrophota bacterium]